MKFKYEKSESKFAVLPEINLAWGKGNYFFVFISWFNYTISYNFFKSINNKLDE